jgi:hypothetical protein
MIIEIACITNPWICYPVPLLIPEVLVPVVELYFCKIVFFSIAIDAMVAKEIDGDFATFFIKTIGIIYH